MKMKILQVFVILLVLVASVLAAGVAKAQTKSICQDYNVCQSSGVCYVSAQRYQCKCPIGRAGKQCEHQITACSFDPCKHGCQALADSQFQCLPARTMDNAVVIHMDASSLLKKSNGSSACDKFGLCKNGGRCYTGYRHSRSRIYRCFCLKGFTGLNCQIKHAFGHDSQLIYKALTEARRNTVNYNHYRSVTQSHEYLHLDGFGQRFLLLNTEIASDISVNRIEFHAAKSGKFLVSFIQVPNCEADVELCATILHELHKNMNQPDLSPKMRQIYSTQLENMLNGSDSHLISASNVGFNTFNFKEPIDVSKGSILCITQIDGRLGGILPRNSTFPDLVVLEENLSDQIYTDDLSEHFDLGPKFISVLVSDTSLIEGAVADNARLSFKSSSSQAASSLASGLECVNHLCVNGGICVPLTQSDSYRCSCPVNTLGNYCEILVNQEPATAEDTIVTVDDSPTTTEADPTDDQEN